MSLRPLILVIEKDEALRQSISSELHEAGYLVATTSPSRGVAKFVVAWPCDLIVIDIDRTDPETVALAAEIHQQVPWTCLLLLTQQPVGDYYLAGQESGVVDYLVKPVKTNDLLENVSNLLAHRIPAPYLTRSIWAEA